MRISYARARLWLGTTCVGLLTAFCGWVAWQPTKPCLFLPLALLAFMALPDFVSYQIQKAYGRKRPEFGAWAKSWAEGTTLQVVLFSACLSLLAEAGRAGGLVLLVLTLIGLQLALVSLAPKLARLAGQLRVVEAAALNEWLSKWGQPGWEGPVWDSEDEAFTGGVVGLPGRERVILPNLPAVEAAVMAIRRRLAVSSGLRTRGLVLSVSWNTVGFMLATQLVPGADITTFLGLLKASLGATGWTFLGLLLLPTFNREAVYEVDRLASQHIPERELRAFIKTFDRRTEDEETRSRLNETIFHPIPSPDRRLDALDRARPRLFGAWHVTRSMLFLSWAHCGWLARAVHCNCGRPELWVLLPCD